VNLEESVEIYDDQTSSIERTSGTSRFIILAESFSGHCCFGYSIIDTSAGVASYGSWKKPICETFDKDEAVMVCYALNQQFK
jgi:hypothetical protein